MKRAILTVMATTMIAAIFLSACSQTQATNRSLDQHHSGQFSAVGEFGELGMTFWKCHRSGEGVRCDRICDYDWYQGRICAPEMHYEFGVISKPSTTVGEADCDADDEVPGQPNREVEAQ